jgi:hypothetical protein
VYDTDIACKSYNVAVKSERYYDLLLCRLSSWTLLARPSAIHFRPPMDDTYIGATRGNPQNSRGLSKACLRSVWAVGGSREEIRDRVGPGTDLGIDRAPERLN